MTTPKETNKAPITNPKGIKIYELSDKEFRIILRKFSKLTKNNNNNKNEKLKPKQNKTPPTTTHINRQQIKLEKQHMNKMRSLRRKQQPTKQKQSEREKDRKYI